MKGILKGAAQVLGALNAEDEVIAAAERNAAYQAEIGGGNPSGALVSTGAGGGMIPAVMEYFTPSNLSIFAALLGQVGQAFDVVSAPFADWPQTIRDAWNVFTRGGYRAIGFMPIRSAENELLANLAPIREARTFITHRAPKGYVAMEYPPGSGRVVAVKKEFARMLGWRPQPKPLMTVSEVKAVQKAHRALTRVQDFALKKNIVEKAMPANTKGLFTKKAKPRSRK